MDELQTKVAALVSQAECAQIEGILTFFQVKALAYAAQEQRFSTFRAFRQYGQKKILPHLTESWFC
jgi:hypothetical protein